MAERILRLRDVLQRYGKSRSTVYLEIRRGVWPQPIALGGRLSGWLESETDAMIRARVAGKSDEEIRQLVTELVSARRSVA